MAEVGERQIRDVLDRARGAVLGGRGPGADDSEIAAHTRNRVVVGGRSATRRLELSYRQAALARGDAEAVRDVLQLSRAELVDSLGRLGERLAPARLARSAARVIGRRLRRRR